MQKEIDTYYSTTKYFELGILSENKSLFEENNIQILISNKESIEKSNNKYELLKVAKKIGIPCVKFMKFQIL